MPSNLPRYNLRTDKELLRKLNYIAEYNGRTANKEIEYLWQPILKKIKICSSRRPACGLHEQGISGRQARAEKERD